MGHHSDNNMNSDCKVIPVLKNHTVKTYGRVKVNSMDSQCQNYMKAKINGILKMQKM